MRPTCVCARNGASGLLVSSITAFAEYQQNQAWVWEHQALTRARFSAGDAAIGADSNADPSAGIVQKAYAAEYAKRVLEMRQKMHAGHPNDSGCSTSSMTAVACGHRIHGAIPGIGIRP